MKTETTQSVQFAYRYAVYFIPALHSEWWAAGCHWLGRCAATGQPLQQPVVPGVAAAQFQSYTQEPRRYGWHATLKAPFELRPGASLASLRQAIQALALALPAFDLPALQVSTEGDFLALRPTRHDDALQATADACVTRLQHWAKPLGAAELARRRQNPLTPAQDQLLTQWGYPWVKDEFKFHLSLSGPLHGLSNAERLALVHAAQQRFETLPRCRFAHIALFVEPEQGADFQWLESVELRG
jgi:putative phosphonate metabolism protein